MKLLKPGFEILDTKKLSVNQMIELAGRTCYKSEDRITEDSADRFVQMLIDRGHGAMLEHGTIYLKYHWSGAVCETCEESIAHDQMSFYYNNKYSRVNRDGNTLYITTNYRVIVEESRLSDMQYECEPTELHDIRRSVRFTCDRGVSHEFVRHRVFSFAQESTRYCNYGKNEHIQFIIPNWFISTSEQVEQLMSAKTNEEVQAAKVPADEYNWGVVMECCEGHYNALIDKKWTPQKARSVLPNSLKTELVMTGFENDWKGFFDLRCDVSAHPQARELANPLLEEFKLKFVYFNGNV